MLEAIDREGRSVGQVIVGELKDDPLVKTDDLLNVVEQAGKPFSRSSGHKPSPLAQDCSAKPQTVQ
jgi:hypothetical protein